MASEFQRCSCTVAMCILGHSFKIQKAHLRSFCWDSSMDVQLASKYLHFDGLCMLGFESLSFRDKALCHTFGEEKQN